MTSQMWGPDVAVRYDKDTPEMYAPEVLDPAVDFLAALAPGGRALEFAVGTGRVALPLSDRGLTVAGIDTSEAMVAVLRAKPGAGRVEVVIGDMSTGTVDGSFDLVYLVFRTSGPASTPSTCSPRAWCRITTRCRTCRCG